MKKITLLALFVLTLSNVNAQFDGDAFYKFRHAITGKYMTVANVNGKDDIVSREELPNNDATQVFEVKSVGTTGNYNISVTISGSSFDALRANSTDLIPTTTATPTSDTNNTRIFSFPLEENGAMLGGYKLHYITTPQTSSGRYMFDRGFDAVTQAPYPDASIGYTGSPAAKATWVLENLTRPLSTKEFNSSSVFITSPVSDNMIIGGLDDKIHQIEVFNVLGESMLKRNTRGESSINLETNALSSGLYLVKFYGETFAFTKKIIKK